MEIPKEDLDEFKRVFKRDYGEQLEDEEAHRIAGRLLDLFKIIYRPLPKEGEKIDDLYV